MQRHDKHLGCIEIQILLSITKDSISIKCLLKKKMLHRKFLHLWLFINPPRNIHKINPFMFFSTSTHSAIETTYFTELCLVNIYDISLCFISGLKLSCCFFSSICILPFIKDNGYNYKQY